MKMIETQGKNIPRMSGGYTKSSLTSCSQTNMHERMVM